MHAKQAFLAMVSLVLSLSAGCLKVERQSPEKQQFVLDVQRPSGGEALTSKISNPKAYLQVNELHVPENYQGRGFKYRKGNLELESDFYNEFFSPPGQMITEEVRRWFDRSGLFGSVVVNSGMISPSYFLDGTLESLFGDHRSDPPKAVLEIEFVLIKSVKGSNQVVFKNQYRQDLPAKGREAKDLAAAWNEDLFNILKAFESDLRSKVFNIS